MTLTPTQTAPKLSLPLTGGGNTDELAMGSGVDGRFSLVLFFRGLHCPVCRKQLSELDGRLDDLREAGVGRVVAVSMETEERSARLVEKWDLKNLSDRARPHRGAGPRVGPVRLHRHQGRRAGCVQRAGHVRARSDGTVFWSNVSSMPFGRPPLDDIIAGLQFVQKSDYPARGAA